MPEQLQTRIATALREKPGTLVSRRKKGRSASIRFERSVRQHPFSTDVPLLPRLPWTGR